MESLYFLVPCALIFVAIAIKVLFWAINNGQYDNLDAEGHRILFEEKNKPVAPKSPLAPPPSPLTPESHRADSQPTSPADTADKSKLDPTSRQAPSADAREKE